jgi:ArsR family transcriptional regulator
MAFMPKRQEQKTAAAFKALGHPVRLQIVRDLAAHGACFSGDISARLPVAASTASQHLKILQGAGLIAGTIDGPRRCYCIRKEALSDLKHWLERL